jgi:hypothetical protein
LPPPRPSPRGRRGDVVQEGDAGQGGRRQTVGQDDLRPVALIAEGFSLLVSAPVRVVAAVRALPDKQGADVLDEPVDRLVGAEVAVIPVVLAARVIGRCPAAISQRSASGRSCAKNW